MSDNRDIKKASFTTPARLLFLKLVPAKTERYRCSFRQTGIPGAQADDNGDPVDERGFYRCRYGAGKSPKDQ